MEWGRERVRGVIARSMVEVSELTTTQTGHSNTGKQIDERQTCCKGRFRENKDQPREHAV
jgi:hypothetical protein